MRWFAVCLILCVLAPMRAAGEEHFPLWVPRGAIEAAKLHCDSLTARADSSYLLKHYCITPQEARNWVLKYPRRIVDVDYERYVPGKNVVDLFRSADKESENTFDFSVFSGETEIIILTVGNRDGSWIVIDSSPQRCSDCGPRPVTDQYRGIYSRYPATLNRIMFQNGREALFVVKSDSLEALYTWNVDKQRFEAVPVDTCMVRMRDNAMRNKEAIESLKNPARRAYERSVKAKKDSTRTP